LSSDPVLDLTSVLRGDPAEPKEPDAALVGVLGVVDLGLGVAVFEAGDLAGEDLVGEALLEEGEGLVLVTSLFKPLVRDAVDLGVLGVVSLGLAGAVFGLAEAKEADVEVVAALI